MKMRKVHSYPSNRISANKSWHMSEEQKELIRQKKIGVKNPNKCGYYEIYNSNNELVCKFHENSQGFC
jgi:hypothetical protein